MIQTKTCINVYSDMNTWIDFCIVIGAYEDFTKAEEIVQKAINDWLSCTTPTEAKELARNNFVTEDYSEEIICGVQDNSVVDYVIP